MPEISMREFEQLPLRVHDFLVGVPLHDVWAIDLPHARPGITLDEFSRTAGAGAHLFKDSPVTRASKPSAASLKASFGVSRTVERTLSKVWQPRENK